MLYDPELVLRFEHATFRGVGVVLVAGRLGISKRGRVYLICISCSPRSPWRGRCLPRYIGKVPS